VIGEVDRWIVTHAIRAMAEHKAHGRRLALAVNISGASAGEEALLTTITEELQAAELDPHDLTLEITETAAVADIPRARRFAEALAAIGCRVALDDFGAGFGSFYYLKHLPFDTLKIDGEFVRHACENAADRLVIKAVTDIARGLGKQTIAEFVPNEQTVRLLVELGVDSAQGYFLGRPRPLEELLPEPALSV
jgi:EAL domain-containing protein (putative c-di-GMP-specific phosphodiesterase class I)